MIHQQPMQPLIVKTKGDSRRAKYINEKIKEACKAFDKEVKNGCK